MWYLFAAFISAWLIYFAYLFYLHLRVRNLWKRFQAREEDSRGSII